MATPLIVKALSLTVRQPRGVVFAAVSKPHAAAILRPRDSTPQSFVAVTHFTNPEGMEF